MQNCSILPELAVPSRRLHRVFSGSMPDEPGGHCSNPETPPASLPNHACSRKESGPEIPSGWCRQARCVQKPKRFQKKDFGFVWVFRHDACRAANRQFVRSQKRIDLAATVFSIEKVGASPAAFPSLPEKHVICQLVLHVEVLEK